MILKLIVLAGIILVIIAFNESSDVQESQAAERQRLAEEEASRQEAERQRLAEEEAARQEAEHQRLAEEEEARQMAERQRLAEEEEARQAAERSQLTPEERKRLAREELELKLGRRTSVQEGKHQETKYQYLAEEALAAKARLAEEERQLLAREEAARQAAERQCLVQGDAPQQAAERKRLAREELEVLARRQRQGQEAGNQLTLEEDFPILTEQWYKNLVAFEDTYYADIVTRDLRAIESGEETLSYSVTGLVAKLLRTKDRRAAMTLQESVNDYTESRPQASLSERRDAIINPENQEYWAYGHDLRLQGTCNYFLESNRDVEVFYNGRKPKNGRRLVLVEQVKGQLKYFGFDEADVTSVIEDPAYGQIVYVAFVKNYGYELVYQTTYYDRIMHLSEDMRDYLVSPNQSVLRRQSGLGRVALSRPSSQGQEPWRNKVEQAIKKDKVPVIRNGQLTKPIDWLTEPSLPVFSGIDVNRFQNDIETLANIMMIVGKYSKMKYK